MTRRLLTVVLLAAMFASPAASQTTTASKTRAHVQTLASERFDGREAGSPGERLAADYIVEELTRIGARPLPGYRDMRLPFEFTSGSRDGGSQVGVRHGSGEARPFASATDVQALSFSDDGEVSGPVVFAGYGIVVPESQNFGYDSYAALDVKDKIVVVLRYFPEDADQQTRGILARYSDLRYKALAARQRGAKALVVVTGPRSPNAGALIPMTFDTALSGSGIPAVTVSGEVGRTIFEGGPALEAVQKDLDSGNPHVPGIDLPSATMTVKTVVVRQRQTAHNVVAYLPATSPTAGIDKPWVAVGAHYDHLGHGTHGNSLAAGEQVGRIYVGADDNASGTAAVLAIAETLAREPRQRNVLVALWSAEEVGLVGSSEFAKAPPVPLDQLAAYLNFDMVGRMQDNKLAIQATGTSDAWAPMLERVNVAAGFDVSLQADPYQPTDVATFNQEGIPSLSFTTGAHPDYHKPSDTADKIDYEDLDRIAGMAASIVRRLMAEPQPPPFTKVQESNQTVSRTGVRVFTGTVPDYTSEAKGLLLGGVIGGGPAEQAGLAKGDVIVEIAGQSIANIYDYTYALELLKIGEPVKVIYRRGGERRETTLTPGARK
jgi:hypothetical protein